MCAGGHAAIAKETLQGLLGLEIDPKAPLFGFIGARPPPPTPPAGMRCSMLGSAQLLSSVDTVAAVRKSRRDLNAGRRHSARRPALRAKKYADSAPQLGQGPTPSGCTTKGHYKWLQPPFTGAFADRFNAFTAFLIAIALRHGWATCGGAAHAGGRNANPEVAHRKQKQQHSISLTRCSSATPHAQALGR